MKVSLATVVVEFPLKTKVQDGREQIFCAVRKKYVLLTPEEWVRQHVIYLLHEERGVAYARMAVERQVKNSKKRFDIVIFHQETGEALVLIECKRKEEKLSQSTFDQVSRYNAKLGVPYLVITNWEEWRAAEIQGEQFRMLESFPKV